ncbi:MAG: hypothetical protein JXB30_05020 [Anaerolineae bacterium]|nr:hypothetical protein [Anaerolineae bacterium]
MANELSKLGIGDIRNLVRRDNSRLKTCNLGNQLPLLRFAHLKPLLDTCRPAYLFQRIEQLADRQPDLR